MEAKNLLKAENTNYKFVGDETLEKVTLPNGRVLIFKSATADEIEAAIKEHRALDVYFKKG